MSGENHNDDLRDVLRALSTSGSRFVVIGGFAMQLHGSSYLTFDLDIAYERTRDNAQLLAAALKPFNPRPRGFPAEVPFRFDAQAIFSTEMLTLTTSAGDVDLLGTVAGVGGYQELKTVADLISFEGIQIYVLGIDGLLQAKRAAGRPKDVAGLIELEAMREARALIELPDVSA